MEKPKAPYQELTTPENADIHGQLRDVTWRNLQIQKARARFLRVLGADLIADQVDDFNKSIIRTSGSIEGAHRNSTVDAIQGQKAPPMALVGAAPPPQGQARPMP